MTDLHFVDTNVLIYAHDRDANHKHVRAKEWMIKLWNQNSGCLSAQVLQEFFVNVTRKIPQPLPVPIAREVIRTYVPWIRIATDGEMVLRATEIAEIWQISFWDGMIVAVAERSGANIVLSEDLQHGQQIASVTVMNPFLHQK